MTYSLPCSTYSMTWAHHNGPDWYGVDWFELTRRGQARSFFRRVKSTRVVCSKYSNGAVPSRMVDLRASYDRLHRQLSASPWAPYHLVEAFGAATRAMDVILEVFEMDLAGQERERLVSRACVDAYGVMENFKRLEHSLTGESSRRGEMGSYGYGLRALEAANTAREEEMERFTQLHSTYTATMGQLEANA